MRQAMNDSELTRLQETGIVPVRGLSLGALVMGCQTLGIDPGTVEIVHGRSSGIPEWVLGDLIVARVRPSRRSPRAVPA